MYGNQGYSKNAQHNKLEETARKMFHTVQVAMLEDLDQRLDLMRKYNDFKNYQTVMS